MLRVGILCSYRAPGLTDLLTHGHDRSRSFEIVTCITSENSFTDTGVLLAHGVPLHVHSLRQFYHSKQVPITDGATRIAYDAETERLLQEYRVDIVVTDAYLYLLTSTMLRRFQRRIINVHHGDLTLRDAVGRPRLPGLRAVRDAILEGELETRATVHLVSRDVDAGPPFLRSWAFPVSPLVAAARRWQATDILKAYTYAHQEWMIRSAWGPLVANALSLIADGRVNLNILQHGDYVWELDETGALLEDDAWSPTSSSSLVATVG